MTSPGQPPKTMSSRLMGMKFMQRSAASSATSSPAAPPSAKRAKLNSGSPLPKRNADQEAFEVVRAQEEAKREAVLDRLAEEAGDTKWVLKIQPQAGPAALSVVTAGYGAIDSATSALLEAIHDEERRDGQDGDQDDDGLDVDDSEHGNNTLAGSGISGRMSFGRFNKQVEKRHNPDLSSSSGEDGESGDESDEDEDEDDSHRAHTSHRSSRDTSVQRQGSAVADDLRASKKAKRKEERKARKDMADRRRRKEVNLNRRPTSISSGGTSKSAASGNMAGSSSSYNRSRRHRAPER